MTDTVDRFKDSDVLNDRIASNASPTRYFVLAAWAFVLSPFSVVAHELGHFLVALAAGFPATLHYSSVKGIHGTPPFGEQPIAVALAVFAGPAVTFLLMIGSVAAFRRDSSRLWALALVAVAPVRMATALFFGLLLILNSTGRVLVTSSATFDELVTLRVLGLPESLAALSALVLIAGLIWTVRNVPPNRWLSMVAIALGSVAGYLTWFGILGPWLLPA